MKDLEKNELMGVDGGNPLAVGAFFAGAILGGIIYDVVKTGWTAAVESYVDGASDRVYGNGQSKLLQIIF